ncbi:MAG: collagen-like protein [Nocardioides sp.]
MTIFAIGGIAGASGPLTDGVIHACYSKRSGLLRAAKACHANEKSLSWSQRGRKGATGAQGPQGLKGDTGAPGPQGPAGITHGYVVATNTLQSIDNGDTRVAYLAPPQGGADYLVLVTGYVQDPFSSQLTSCRLQLHNVATNANTDLQSLQVETSSTGSFDPVPFAMSAMTSLPNLNGIQVLCSSEDNNGYASIGRITLTATQLAAIN